MPESTPPQPPPRSALEHHLTDLTRPCIMAQYAELATQAARKSWSHVDSLARLVEGEADVRKDRATTSRIQLARFPVITTVALCRWDWPTRINRLQGQNHFHLAFITDKANRIFLGGVGLGKSTLVAALRAHVRQAEALRIALRCSPYHTNSMPYPVIEHVQRWLGVTPDTPPETKLARLEEGLRASRLPLEEAVPLLAALLSVPVPDGRYTPPRLTPQQHKQQTLDTLVAWLLEAAERQPLLAVWEDLHWADPTTLELLGLVIEQAPTVSLLTVLTCRPTFVPPWPSRSHLTPITLNRLERPQAEALLTHLAGGKTLPAEVVQHIVAKTDGVPLFVEELTKMLLESGVLRAEADHYALTGPLSAVTIPATLQDSLMARLDRLPSAREVAQLGAVLGREFPYAMLRALSPLDEGTLQARLAQLVAAELLYQRRPPRATYVFKHALIQDAAYASLLRSTRQQYHQRIAQMLAARCAEMVETRPELLAHHYTEAALPEDAVPCWYRAGQQGRAWELRTALSLSRLWQQQGK